MLQLNFCVLSLCIPPAPSIPSPAFLTGKDSEQLFSTHSLDATNNFNRLCCILSLKHYVPVGVPGWTVLPDMERSSLKSSHSKRVSQGEGWWLITHNWRLTPKRKLQKGMFSGLVSISTLIFHTFFALLNAPSGYFARIVTALWSPFCSINQYRAQHWKLNSATLSLRVIIVHVISTDFHMSF